MAQRIISALHAVLSDGTEVAQGDTVNLTAEDEQRFDEQRALVPHGHDSFEAWSAFIQDAYRGGRGDTEAAKRLAEGRKGGIVDLSGANDVDSYIEWLRSETPTVDEVNAAAGDDPDKARALLEAETAVTGGEPRAGVEKHLTKVIGEG